MIRLSKISVYPIKSLDPVHLESVQIGANALKNDRRFALKADDDRYINGKRTGLVNQLEARYDLVNGSVQLGQRGTGNFQSFELRVDNPELIDYLKQFFDMNLRLVESDQGALMDMPERAAVTLISTSSYESLLLCSNSQSLDDLRLRFRANLEFEAPEAYWEERLIHSPGVGVRFTVGDVEMMGLSPRKRCNVPPRNPWTGKTDKSFVKKMKQYRENTLPDFSPLKKFGDMYYLTINTLIPLTEKGKTLSIGDELRILELVTLDM